MKIVVLGAGVVGTTSAWFLAKAGHEVTVIERQAGAGLETSFANGGQVSVSHALPWANPDSLRKLPGWLFREDAPLLFRLRPDLHQWLWGLAFLRECLPSRVRSNIEQIVNLGLYSRALLVELRRETGIEYDSLQRGILHFYTSTQEFEAALEPAALMREYGCEQQVKTPDECVQTEPALAAVRHQLAGGTYTPSDESGDAHLFTRKLAQLAAARGVRFSYGQTILGLERAGGEIGGVRIRDAAGGATSLHQADAYVMALGSYSPLLLRPLGISTLIYPAKGYSATLQLQDPARAPQVSLTDDEYKLVFSRLGNRLRVAGTAEFTGYDTTLNATRCEALVRRTQALFPGAGDAASATFWTGLRPATPGNVPLIGRTRYRNLYLNTGHGTLGWTHACGSGRVLADLVNGREPEIAVRFANLLAA